MRFYSYFMDEGTEAQRGEQQGRTDDWVSQSGLLGLPSSSKEHIQ